jgi:hypothetical protein
MPWRDFLKRKRADIQQQQQQQQPEHTGTTTQAATQIIGRRQARADDPAALERRRKRLERRAADLRYDLALAESALRMPNRWSERVEQLNAAIEQAQRDIRTTLEAPPGRAGVALPPWPLVVDAVQPQEPAEVRFRIDDVAFRYSEEIDWAERGHQKAEPQLRRTAGDVAALLPPDVPDDRAGELTEHLAHGLATLAAQLRDDALVGHTTPLYTLADLASPCPECGGWRDLRGRCPACQARQWAAERLRADADRLINERNDQLEEARRWSERLPIIQRQLADTEAELAALPREHTPSA